jgi:hypothetical protein
MSLYDEEFRADLERRKMDEQFNIYLKKLTSLPDEYNRQDVKTLLLMNDKAFQGWYDCQKSNTELLLNQWELFADIPDLSYGKGSNKKMDSALTIRDIVEKLRKGLQYINDIKSFRDDLHKSGLP